MEKTIEQSKQFWNEENTEDAQYLISTPRVKGAAEREETPCPGAVGPELDSHVNSQLVVLKTSGEYPWWHF